MSRPDLLALTPDDLAALANRGLVKRAQRELESGGLEASWSCGADATVEAAWSDGATVTLPGGATVKEARCTCGAFELCRHVLRTVLAWQVRAEAAGSPAASGPWDPGGLDDATLRVQCARGVWEKAVGLRERGLLAELLRTAKPTARFHSPGHTVRFPVPGDARYAVCSCAEPAPCVHAVLGVQAFRLLPPEQTAGLISEGPLDAPIPPAVLAEAAACFDDLLADGLASGSTSWRDRLRRVAGACSAAGLVCPAQLLEEMAVDYERYHAGDAAFQPATLVRRAGELLLRLDAIRSGVAPVPQTFIRGLRTDRDSDLGSSRLVGLGAGTQEERRSTTVSVVLQDLASGNLLTLERVFQEDPDQPRKAFEQLARVTATREANLGQIARGQLVLQGGRRTAAGRLVLGRARAAVHAQTFAWEHLSAPVLVEDFAELEARLRLLPPAPFRPRRASADFHVCPVSEVRHASFDATRNVVLAELRDAQGGSAWLQHPWTERGRIGAEALLRALQEEHPRFVSGWISRRDGGLLVHPAAFVSEVGGIRRAVLPGLEVAGPAAQTSGGTATAPPATWGRGPHTPAAHLLENLLLSGSRRLASAGWPGWGRVEEELAASGLRRGSALVQATWRGDDSTAAARQLLKLVVLAEAV